MPFGQLRLSARLYILFCYVLGLAATGWLCWQSQPLTLEDWLITAALATVAGACQVFLVAKTRTGYSDNLTPAPLFAALLLLPRPALALMLIVTFLPEWYIHRRAWYIQLWNIASYLITAAIARSLLFQLTGEWELQQILSTSSLKILLLIPCFIGIHTVLLAWVIKLARGQSFVQSGLFAAQKLLFEGALACLGLAFATAWLAGPLYGLAAAMPLALFFQALHVPNLTREATSDPKTQLANMRHFNVAATRDLERSQRSGQPVSLLMCDLDYLRNINNTYGHQAGDTVLMGIADILRLHIRSGDIAARFGGEEFVILLADTDIELALDIAERLRRELEQSQFDIGASEPIRATISIGVASSREHGRSLDILLREADLAVYKAKRDGRNRVVVAGRTSRELAGEWAREHLVPAALDEKQPDQQSSTPRFNFVRSATRWSGDVLWKPERSTPRQSLAVMEAEPRQRRPPAPTPALLAFIGVIVVGGIAGLVLGWPLQGPIPWWSLLLFAGLTVMAEQVAAATVNRSLTSVAVVAVMGAMFLDGELGIITTALVLVGVAAVKAHSRLHRMLFNFGTILLSAEGAHTVFRLFIPGAITSHPLSMTIVPAVLAGLTYYAINHTLLCIVRGIAEHRSPIEIWHADYRWLAPHYVVMGGLGLVVALGYIYLGWIGVIALMAPVGMMHVAIKQYVDRTNIHVNELQRMNGRLTDSYEATLQALSRALDTRDEETEEHSQRVRRYTNLIAARLDIAPAEQEDISRGALLHDLGKIGVPDAILLKPGRLTEEERAQMRKHPEIGYSMIAHIPFLTHAAQVVLHHHEAYDGSGYPSGLAGNNIPLGARIFAVADTFDAMTSDRPYRKAGTIEDAIAELRRCRGQQFDPLVVDTFLSIPMAELLAARAGTAAPMTTSLAPTSPEERRALIAA